MATPHPFLQPSPFAADYGTLIGRDPREITEAEWADHLTEVTVGLAVIRAKCLDCAHNTAEVRKCTVVACPLWPFRMGTFPAALRAHQRASQEAAAAAIDRDDPEYLARVERLAKARAARAAVGDDDDPATEGAA